MTKLNKIANIIKNNWQYSLSILLVAIIIVIGLLYIFNRPEPAAAWFNDGWHYRQEVSITNAGSEKTDYKAMVQVDTATLVTAGKLQADCDDIRFTDISGDLLSYSLETACNLASTKFWVKVPVIPASDATIYLYYGNVSAIAGKESKIGTSEYPALSCRVILATDSTASNGIYWLDTTNGSTTDKFEAYCDMSIDGGGYMMIARTGDSCAGNFGWSSSTGGIRDMTNCYSMGIGVNGTQFDVALWGINSPGGTAGNYNWGTYVYKKNFSEANIATYSASATSAVVPTAVVGGNTGATMQQVWGFTSSTTKYYMRDCCGDSSYGMQGTHFQSTYCTDDRGGYLCNEKAMLMVKETSFTFADLGYSNGSEEKGPGPIGYWSFDEGYGNITRNSMPLDNWWDDNWKYRVVATVDTGYTPRLSNTVVEKVVDFTSLGVSNIDTNSVRVVRDGEEISSDVVRWFDTNTKAMVRWKMEGTTNPKESTIQYYIYFDTTDNPKASVSYSMPKEYAIQASSDTAPTSFWWAYSNYDGTFGSFTEINTGYENSDVVIFDKDNDGDFDFAITHDDNGTHGLSVWQNNGSESFTKTETFDSDGNWNGVDMADFNEDGYLDMVSSYGYNTSVNARIYLNDGDGTFTQGSSLGQCGTDVYARRAAVGDFDGDKNMDIIVGGYGGGNDAICVYWGDGAGSFSSPAVVSNSTADHTDMHGIAVADFNHDGYDDFAVHKSFRIFYYYQSQGSGRAFNNKTATHPGGTWPAIAATSSWTDLSLWDVNKDGTLDLTGNDWASPYQAWIAFGTYRATGGYPDSWASTSTSIRAAGTAAMEFTGPDKLQYSTNSINIELSNFAYNTHAIISGATWQTEDMCISGKCLLFDGVDDYVNITHSTNFTTNLQAGFTMSAWIKPSSAGEGNYGRIFNKTTDADAAAGFYLRLDNTSNRLAARVNSGSTIYSAFNSIVHGNGAWYHVAATITSSGLVTFYVNGIQSGTPASTSGLSGITTTNDLRIGNASSGTTYTFDGFIDEPKIHDYARTASQVKADYLAGQSGSPSGASASFGGGQQNKSEGLVGYWKMDEASGNILDASGNNNTGTPTGTTVVAGKYGNGRSFNGSSDYLTIPSASLLKPTNQITVSAWIYPHSPTDYYGEVIQKNDRMDWRLRFSSTTGKIEFMSDTDTSAGTAQYDVPLSANNWYHVVGVADIMVNKVYIYVDGELKDDSPLTGTALGTSNGDIMMGTIPSAAEDFDGVIDEVKIYNVARTADQIMRDYKQGPPPMAYYNFEEGSGTTLYDKSGNEYSSDSFGGSPAWTLGKYGTALNLDNNGYARNNSFSIGSDPVFTVTGWFKRTDSTTTSGPWAIGAGGTVQQTISGYNNSGEKIGIDSWGTSTYYVNDEYPLNDWVYVTWIKTATTFTPSTLKIYVNGIEKSLNVLRDGVDTISLSAGLTLGGIQPSSVYNSPMTIDDFKIYNYVRNQEQILWDMYGDENNHPMIHLNFDEGYGTNVVDSINGYDLTNSGADWILNGRFNKALNFNGSSDYLTRSISSDDWVDSSSGSISMWFNWDSNDTGGLAGLLAIQDTNTNNNFFRLSLGNTTGNWNDESIRVEFYDNTTWAYNYAYRNGETFYRDGLWHNVIFTVDNNGNKLYVDGEELMVSQWSFSLEGQSSTRWLDDIPEVNTIFIGSIYNDPAPYINIKGSLDDIKIFSFALSPEQIRQEYNQGSQVSLGQQKTSSETWDAGGFGGSAPIAYWNFEDSGQTTYLYDKAGTNNGTLIGSMTSDDWILGKIGSGLNFNNNQGATLSSTINLADTSNWTISSWVKTSSAGDETVISNSSGGPVTSDIGISSTHKIMYRHYDGAWQYEYGTSDVNDNQWHFLTWVNHSDQTIDMYVDGILENDGANSIETSTGPVNQIGRNWKTAANISIDEVKYFNYARTQAQIAYDYNGGQPVGWWPLDDKEGITAIDISGNGNNGTLTNMDPANDWVDGVFEGALDFDGTDDNVSIPQNSLINLSSNNPFSISYWVNLNRIDGTYQASICKGGFSTSYCHLIGSAQGLLLIYTDDDSSQEYQSTNYFVTGDENSWVQVTQTYDGDKIYVYKNGILNGSSGSGILLTTSTDTLYIGSNGPTSYPFDGQLDDIRIYNYALTADQVKEVMNYGSVYIK